jgi:hypothetical protein
LGLDLLEFAWSVENAFGLHIPEADSATLATPGLLIDYLASRLSPGASSQCVDQIAFFKIRGAAIRVLNQPRHAIRPETSWASVLPRGAERRHSWELLQHAVSLPVWPKLSVLGSIPRDAATVGSTATFVATRCPGAVKGTTGTWTNAEITRVIRRLMAQELGVTQFNRSDRFSEDLRIH